jgi:hypothetical protein
VVGRNVSKEGAKFRRTRTAIKKLTLTCDSDELMNLLVVELVRG